MSAPIIARAQPMGRFTVESQSQSLFSAIQDAQAFEVVQNRFDIDAPRNQQITAPLDYCAEII